MLFCPLLSDIAVWVIIDDDGRRSTKAVGVTPADPIMDDIHYRFYHDWYYKRKQDKRRHMVEKPT